MQLVESTEFITALRTVVRLEGGYSDNPDDSGGKTRYGITEALARRYGYRGRMRELPIATARRIYWLEFWLPICGDALAEISPEVALETFDTAVNQGTHQAGTYLQRALNVFNRRESLYPDILTDGDIGPQTVKTLRLFFAAEGDATSPQEAADLLLRAVNCMQGDYYISLAERRQKDESFIRGWLRHRVALPSERNAA